MSKFALSAQTSHGLSVSALEEASRTGARDADIEHLFLALVLSEQAAGRALRDLGITLTAAREAVQQQHNAQLSSLGIDAEFPEAGRIVFHELDGFELTKRATDLLVRSSKKGKSGDASAVLGELLAEPSGMITSILERLGVSVQQVSQALAQQEAKPVGGSNTGISGRRPAAGTSGAFIMASVETVRNFLDDPQNITIWDQRAGTIEPSTAEEDVNEQWIVTAPTIWPNGKPVEVKPEFRRRLVRRTQPQQAGSLAWSFNYIDSPQACGSVVEFGLQETTGGTQLSVRITPNRRRGWQKIKWIALLPVQKFGLWTYRFHIAAAISRYYR